MFQPFESHAYQWMKRHEKAAEESCQKSFAETPTSQTHFDRFIRTAATANPPIILPSFAQESYQRACSEHLLEDEYGAPSYDLEPKLGPSVQMPLGRNKLMPLPPAYLEAKSDFERQDPQTVHTKLESIDQSFISIGGNLYQMREVIDYWLPKENQTEFEVARSIWLPSQLIEQARLRTIHELNFIQTCFTEHLQAVSNAICELREGAFGGRLNTKTVMGAKQLFERLGDLRRLVLRLQRPAEERARSLRVTGKWFEDVCLPALMEIKGPYRPERFDPQDPSISDYSETFKHHLLSMLSAIRFLAQSFYSLSDIFVTIDHISRTIVEGLHKIMFDLHVGQTTGEFIASWASRWERVTFGLLIKVLGLPAINIGLQRSFPGTEVDFVHGH